MKSFHVKHDDEAIHLETIHTKLGSLERLIIVAAKEFVKRGKTDNLKRILARIEIMMM